METADDDHHTISKEWLQNILDKHFGNENSSVNLTSFTTKQGCDPLESVLSDIISITANLDVRGKPETLHLIIKLLPLNPFTRFFVAEAQFDLREIKFYTQIAPELENFQKGKGKEILLPIPKCYMAKYVSFDEAETETPPSTPTASVDESVIVLQDLKHEGFVGVDFKKGLTFEQAESAFEAISRLHALSLALKVKEKRNLTERYPFLFQTKRASDSYQRLIDRGLPQLIKFLEKKEETKGIIDCLAVIRPNTKDLIEAFLTPEEPMALITHTDFWSNNLLFNNDRCAILDWQMITCSRPSNDLALLAISSLTTTLRREKIFHLLDGYWTNLVSHSETLGLDIENELGYDRARLQEDYRRSQLLALLLCIGSVDVAFGDPETEQRLLDVLTDLHKEGILSADIIPKYHLTV